MVFGRICEVGEKAVGIRCAILFFGDLLYRYWVYVSVGFVLIFGEVGYDICCNILQCHFLKSVHRGDYLSYRLSPRRSTKVDWEILNRLSSKYSCGDFEMWNGGW